jgi:hypothetical protein
MDNKIDDGFRIHGGKENDGDSIQQSRCDIIDQKSHSPHTNKTHCVQHHFVQEQVENGEVRFEYCLTEHMVVDVLTKALSKERHYKLINMFGLETS